MFEYEVSEERKKKEEGELVSMFAISGVCYKKEQACNENNSEVSIHKINCKL